MRRSKSGAIELSMSTIVIVVLAMALLIGGIVLVRNILSGANEVVSLANENVLKEINSLFSEGSDIVVKLGSSKTAKVRADGEPAGVVFAASTIDGDGDTRDMKYILSLDSAARENCLTELGEPETKLLFDQKFEEEIKFIQSNMGIAATQIIVQVPEGTKLCSQKVLIEVFDGENFIGQDYFIVQITKPGLF